MIAAGFVYAIESGGLVKIGWSGDPRRRLAKIASDSPHAAKLLGVIAGGKDDEAALHQKFSVFRVRREWFALPAEIIAEIGRSWRTLGVENVAATHLSQILKAKGLKAADLARLLGVDKATVSRWEHGTIPAERVPEIEQSTGVPRHELRPDLWPRDGAAA